MKVGGRDFNWSKQDVENAMRGQDPELIRKYVVEVVGTVFPPKQVLAHVTGWERQSFTTMEAQRVLNRLGFVCREAEVLDDGLPGWRRVATDGPGGPGLLERVGALEAALATAQEAIAGLAARVRSLEG
jgi:hypothetical protein